MSPMGIALQDTCTGTLTRRPVASQLDTWLGPRIDLRLGPQIGPLFGPLFGHQIRPLFGPLFGHQIETLFGTYVWYPSRDLSSFLQYGHMLLPYRPRPIEDHTVPLTRRPVASQLDT